MRAHTLGERAGSRRSVADPGDGSDADLEDIVRQIEGLIEHGGEEIVRLVDPGDTPTA